MLTALASLIDRLESQALRTARVIDWGSPVPSFGDFLSAQIATVGLNPSNREFVDESGRELEGNARRFHTLSSLGIPSWSEADASHVRQMADACRSYFSGNPYARWFGILERVIAGTGASFYGKGTRACHLDLIPYATDCKWTDLSPRERATLLRVSGDTLAILLRDSPIRILVLNGQTVVNQFQEVAGGSLESREMPRWTLPRNSGRPIAGIAYSGIVTSLCGWELGQPLLVLGFNHNLQSSFGVTNEVMRNIRDWITHESERWL